MRQEKDPNFKAGKAEQPREDRQGAAGKGGAKRKTGVGFQEEEAGKGKRQKTATPAVSRAGPRYPPPLPATLPPSLAPPSSNHSRLFT